MPRSSTFNAIFVIMQHLILRNTASKIKNFTPSDFTDEWTVEHHALRPHMKKTYRFPERNCEKYANFKIEKQRQLLSSLSYFLCSDYHSAKFSHIDVVWTTKTQQQTNNNHTRSLDRRQRRSVGMVFCSNFCRFKSFTDISGSNSSLNSFVFISSLVLTMLSFCRRTNNLITCNPKQNMKQEQQ